MSHRLEALGFIFQSLEARFIPATRYPANFPRVIAMIGCQARGFLIPSFVN